jgi:hypothetical protein
MSKGEESAFPIEELHQSPAAGVPSKVMLGGGLTKREYFAAAAMQGILANPAWDPNVHRDEKRVAFTARINADALLAELAKEPKP